MPDEELYVFNDLSTLSGALDFLPVRRSFIRNNGSYITILKTKKEKNGVFRLVKILRHL